MRRYVFGSLSVIDWPRTRWQMSRRPWSLSIAIGAFKHAVLRLSSVTSRCSHQSSITPAVNGALVH